MTATVAAAPTVTLSDRQAEVLALMARGLDFPAISKLMQISVETARGHLKQAMKHLGAANGTQAVALALTHGLIPAIPSRGVS